MYINNKQLISLLLEEFGVDDLYKYLNTSLLLVKKYKKLLFNPKIFEKILKEEEKLAVFLAVLKKYNKIKISEIKKLILLTKELDGYTARFEVKVPKESYLQKIEEYLNQKIGNCEVSSNLSKREIYIGGEGYYFKRNLDMDLKKLLD